MKFAYKSYQRALSDSQLNMLGSEGWELVIHTVAVGSHSAVQYYVFKKAYEGEIVPEAPSLQRAMPNVDLLDTPIQTPSKWYKFW